MTKKQLSTLGLLLLSVREAVKSKSESAKIKIERKMSVKNDWIKSIIDKLLDLDKALAYIKNKK